MGKHKPRSLFILFFPFASFPLAIVIHLVDPTMLKTAGFSSADFPEISTDVFKEMDGEIQLTDEEIKGRNTWILWTAGNQVFWDLSVRMEFRDRQVIHCGGEFPKCLDFHFRR